MSTIARPSPLRVTRRNLLRVIRPTLRYTGPGVTSRDVAFEMDAYMDWKVNKNFTFSFVGAYLNPGEAVQQAFNRTKNFAYGMIYLGYSY